MTTTTSRRLSLQTLLGNFPTGGVYREPRKAQVDMLTFMAEHNSTLIEAPTGSGKTAVECAIARAWSRALDGTVFIITPNKTILDQIRNEFPDLKVALGRNEHPCLYDIKDKQNLTPITVEGLRVNSQNPRADEVPCSFLQDCPHRVDQKTGETNEPGAYACPYLRQKYEAKTGGVVLATMSFYLFTHLFSQEFDTKALVIDEVHRFAEVVRNALSYEITDYHLERSEDMLKDIAPTEAALIRKFRFAMVGIAKKKTPGETTLLKPEEIERLIAIIADIDAKALAAVIKEAVKTGVINPHEDRVTLKKLETLVRDLRRYVTSLGYSIPTEERKALNYTCAFHRIEKTEGQKIQHKLVVKCYFVVPIIRKIMPDTRASLSATIGNNETFGFETGIKDPFLTLGSNFPVSNTRIYLPKDTPNLAMNARSNRDLPKVLRRIARAAKQFANEGIRSLVVVVSNQEREKFLFMAGEEGLQAVSYGNGVTAKEAALSFKDGTGEALVGTAANYAEGIDLPQQIAPVIFFLRPSYPNPRDPGTQFEEERWGNQRWAIWNWRVMQQAMQVRGRNIRSRTDVGVTFFISQQFKRVVFPALPVALQDAYKNGFTLDECVADVMKLLK